MGEVGSLDDRPSIYRQLKRLDIDRNRTPTLDRSRLAQSAGWGLTNLTIVGLLITLIGYAIVYNALAGAMVYLMRKYATAGPDAAMHESVDIAPEFVGAQD